MEFNSLDEILAHGFVGNFGSDSEAFGAIEKFARNTKNSMADRAKALRHWSEQGMGIPTDDLTDERIIASLDL